MVEGDALVGVALDDGIVAGLNGFVGANRSVPLIDDIGVLVHHGGGGHGVGVVSG